VLLIAQRQASKVKLLSRNQARGASSMNKVMTRNALAAVVAAAACSLFVAVSAQTSTVKTVDVGTSTGQEMAWRKLINPAEEFEQTVFAKLKSGDVDWLVDNTEQKAYSKLGKDVYRKLLLEQFIPYFKDFSKPDTNLTICIANCGGERGFSFYDFFDSTNGKKKAYMIEVYPDSNQRHHIYCITMGTSFKDEYPHGKEDIVLFRRENALDFMERTKNW
jgi:hypothetical protein